MHYIKKQKLLICYLSVFFGFLNIIIQNVNALRRPINMKNKAIMIGAGLANMAGAVYLIQEGKWSGKNITFYALDNHGSNDGSTANEASEEYWNTRGAS